MHSRPVYVDPRDYTKAWQLGLHVDDSAPIPLFLSTTNHGEVYVFSTLFSVSAHLNHLAIRFVSRQFVPRS